MKELQRGELFFMRFPERNRKDIVDCLRIGEPILLERYRMRGDNLISTWTAHLALLRLCEEEGLDPSSVVIENYWDRLVPYANDLSLRIEHYDNIHNIDTWAFIPRKYMKATSMLGVTPIPDDLLLVPQPLPVKGSYLEAFNSQEVVAKGKKMIEVDRARGQKRIVIVQSGSSMIKRYSTSHISHIANAVRKSDPLAYIVVLSDADYLTRAITEKADLISVDFPIHDREFLKELRNTGNSSFGADVNEVIVIQDINDICAQGYAAHISITTDSYWAWLVASGKAMRADRNGRIAPTDAIVLHTLYVPDFICIPGAHTVCTPLLQTMIDAESVIRYGYMSPKHYYFDRNIPYNTQAPFAIAIDDASIKKVIDAFTQDFSSNGRIK